MPERYFPPPWSVDELEACFIVLDASGQKLGYLQFEDERQRRSAFGLLTKTKRGAWRPTSPCRSYYVSKMTLT